MAIVFSCADCGHTIKARDDLAGKKVKCPGCQAVVRIPAASEASPVREAAKGAPSAPPPPRDEGVRRDPPRPAPTRGDDEDDRGRRRPYADDDRPRRPRDEDDEDMERDRPRSRGRSRDDDEEDAPWRRRDRDDRPRKAGSKKGLIIGLSVGGGVLLIGIVVLIILLTSGGGSGPGGGPGGGPGMGKGGGTPPPDRALDNDLKMIGLAYHSAHDVLRRGPANAEELRPHLGGGGSAFNRLTSGQVVFIYNVRLTEMLDGTVDTIVAYDRDAPTRGGHVLFGDGHTELLSAAEFNSKPKAQPRK